MAKTLEKLFEKDGKFVSISGEIKNPQPVGAPLLIHDDEFFAGQSYLWKNVVENFLKKTSIKDKSEINAYALGMNTYTHPKDDSVKRTKFYPIQFYKI